MLSQDSYILAFRAVTTNEAEFKDDPVSYVMSRASEKAGNKYFGSSLPGFEAEKSGDEVLVKGNAQTNHAAMGRYFLKPQSGWDYEAAGKAKRMEYSKTIRRMTRIKDIGSELLDFNTGEE